MIQYRLHLESGTKECHYGNGLPIGLDRGYPKYGPAAELIELIEVYVSGQNEPGAFKIVGTELSAADSYVREGKLEESSIPTNDPGRFLGWYRETSGAVRTLTLSFKAPESYESVHNWELSESGAPPPAIKVKIKRQGAAEMGDCWDWSDI